MYLRQITLNPFGYVILNSKLDIIFSSQDVAKVNEIKCAKCLTHNTHSVNGQYIILEAAKDFAALGAVLLLLFLFLLIFIFLSCRGGFVGLLKILIVGLSAFDTVLLDSPLNI